MLLLAQAIETFNSNSLVSGGATVILAGVVVWLAKAYRDDMKEHGKQCAASNEKIADRFTETTKEMQSNYSIELDKVSNAVDKLCDKVNDLHCRNPLDRKG